MTVANCNIRLLVLLHLGTSFIHKNVIHEHKNVANVKCIRELKKVWKYRQRSVIRAEPYCDRNKERIRLTRTWMQKKKKKHLAKAQQSMTKMGGDQEDATVRDGGENIQMK